MRNGWVLLLIVVFEAFGTPGNASAEGAKRVFAGADLFSLQWVSSPEIRSDGKFAAYVRHRNDVTTDSELHSIWIVDIRSGAQKQVDTRPGSYSSPRWSPDGERIAYVYGAGEGKSPQVYVYTIRTGATQAVTNVTQPPHDLAWSPDGRSIAFIMLVPEPPLTLGATLSKPDGASWADPLIVIKDVNYRVDGKGYWKRGYSHVFLVSAAGGEARQVTSGSYTEVGPLAWTVDGAGLLLATNREADWERQPMDPSGSHPRHMNIYRLDLNGGVLTALNPQRTGSFHNPTASPDGRWIAYLGFDDRHLGSQDSQLTILDRGGQSRTLTTDLDRPVEKCLWAADSRGLYCSYVDAGVTQVGKFLLAGKPSLGLATLSPGAGNLDLPESGGEFSLANDGALAYTSGASERPPELSVSRGGREAQVTRSNNELMATVQFGSLRVLPVTSSYDQRKIGAWELLPPNFDSHKRYPLILEIHGGPYWSDGPLFSTEHQLFAAAGYVVVYGNPRGSTSYGAEFANLIHYHFPEHDFDDLMSIVDAAVANGSADPDNLFVTGQSGGGVLTAWTVGSTHRFRAAASQSPAVDWTSWSVTSDVYAYVARNWFRQLPWEDHATYWKQSPLSRVGNVTTPTLMMVGDRDLRTPSSQAQEFYQALQLRNIPTGLVVIPGAFHAEFSPSQMAAQVSATLAWFERFRKPATP